MGFRVKRYGPASTMVVVGRLVGTFEPARVIVTMAQANSASARTNTIAPSQLAGRSGGRNGKGTSQLSASPATTASPNASGGRIMTSGVSAVLSMAVLVYITLQTEPFVLSIWRDGIEPARPYLLLSTRTRGDPECRAGGWGSHRSSLHWPGPWPPACPPRNS